MKDEIKEILDRFNYVKKEPNKLSYYPEDLLTREEMLLLYDYITNLQEKNKRLDKFVDDLLEWKKNIRHGDKISKDNMFLKNVLNDNEMILFIEEFKEGTDNG